MYLFSVYTHENAYLFIIYMWVCINIYMHIVWITFIIGYESLFYPPTL